MSATPTAVMPNDSLRSSVRTPSVGHPTTASANSGMMIFGPSPERSTAARRRILTMTAPRSSRPELTEVRRTRSERGPQPLYWHGGAHHDLAQTVRVVDIDVAQLVR